MDLFRAPSYRDYLRSWVEARRVEPKATLARCARELGLPVQTFKMVLGGHRNLTVDNLQALCDGLRLAGSEREYFEAMVHSDQATTQAARRHYRRRMKQLAPPPPPGKARHFRTGNSDLFSAWYLPAAFIYVFEKLGCKDPAAVSLDAVREALASLGLPAAEATRCFDSLARSNVLKALEDEKYHVSFDQVMSRISRKRYVRESQKVVAARMDVQFDNPAALYMSHCFSISKDKLKELYSDYNALLQRYVTMGSDPDDFEIVQFVGQCLPLLQSSHARGSAT